MKCDLEKLLIDSGDFTLSVRSAVRMRQHGEKYYFRSKWGPVPVSTTRALAARRVWSYLAPEDLPRFLVNIDWSAQNPYTWRPIVARACELALAQGLE